MDELAEPGENDPSPEEIRKMMLRIRSENERADRLKGIRFRADFKPVQIQVISVPRSLHGVRTQE